MARQTVSELVVRVGSDVEEALNGLNKLSVGAQRMGRRVSRTGRTLTRNLTLPIAGVGAAGFKLASDLETSFARMEGLVGVQRSQLDEWEGDVRGLAVTYGQSASKAADALFFITSAGLEGSDAMDALEASMKASAAGLGEISTIADLTTSAMNAYGSDVLSAAQATDVLTAAVREGKLEPEALAGSMGRVIPIASAMGIQFHEVGAAMAAMSRTGTQADEAATQLRSIMTSLLKPTTEAEGALAGMGLSAAGLRSQIKDQGLLSTLQTLAQEFEGNDEAAAKVFGNVRALSGVLDLMGSNAEDTAGIFRDMTTATGATDDAFAAMAETAQFKLNQAIAASKDLLITIGNAVLPVVVQILEKTVAAIRPVAEWFQNLDPRIQKVIVVVGALVAAIGPLLLGLGGIITAGGTLVGVVTSVGAVLAGVTAPVAAVVAALAGLTAAFVVAYKESEAFRNVVSKAIDATRKAVGKALALAMDVATELAEHFGAIAEEIVETLEVRLVEPFMELWDMWGEEIMSAVKVVWEAFARTVRTQFDIVKALVKGAIGVISNTIQLGLNVIQGDWEGAWGNVKGIFRSTKTAVVEIVTALVTAIKEQFGEPLREIIDLANRVKDGVTGAFGAMKDTIVGNSIVPDMVDAVVSEFERMTDQTAGESDTLVDRVVDIFGGLQSKLEELLGPMPEAIGGIFRDLGEALSIGGMGIDVGNEIGKWIDWARDIVDALKTVWDFIKKHGDKILDFFNTVGSGPQFGGFGGGGSGFGGEGLGPQGPLPPPTIAPQGTGAGTQQIHLLGVLVSQMAVVIQILDPMRKGLESMVGELGGNLFPVLRSLNHKADQQIRQLLTIAVESINARMLLGNAVTHLGDIARGLAGQATTTAGAQMAAGPGMTMAGGGTATAPAGGGVQIINHFHGDIQGLTAEQIGEAVSRATVDKIDEGLGTKAAHRRATSGEAIQA